MLSDACLLADPGDFSSANRYNVTFPFTNGGDPACNALSSPIIINLVDDDIFEDVEFFEAHIAVTSDRLKVGIDSQDAISVFITDDDCEYLDLQSRFRIRKSIIMLKKISQIPPSKGDGNVIFVSFSARFVVKKGSHYKWRQSQFARHLHKIIMFTC